MPICVSAAVFSRCNLSSTLRSSVLAWLLGLMLSAALSLPVSAGAGIGMFGSLDDDTRHGKYSQYELYTIRDLPWQGMWRGAQVSTHLFAGAGLYQQLDDQLEYVTLGPVLRLQRPESWFMLELGIRPGILADYRSPGLNFGGHFTFFDHIGLFIEPNNSVQIGYRYQHMSNGSIYTVNPGINMHLLDFRLRLP